MPVYHVKLKVDNSEIETKLEFLSERHKLAAFIYISVEAYLSTPEGIKICSALCGGSGEKSRPKKQETKTSSTCASAVSQVHLSKVHAIPLQQKSEEKSEVSPPLLQGKSDFVSTDDLERQIFKKKEVVHAEV